MYVSGFKLKLHVSEEKIRKLGENESIDAKLNVAKIHQKSKGG